MFLLTTATCRPIRNWALNGFNLQSDEFAILFNVKMSGNPLFPNENYEEFSLDNFSRGECIVEFRVKKNDLRVWQMPLEFHLFSVACRGSCLKEWKACVCCLRWLHIVS